MKKITLPEELLVKYSFFKAGTRLFNQGDSGADIYILKKGAVTVIVDGQIMGLINTSDTIIGEMAYFLGLKRTASIEAVEDSEFLVIPGEYLYESVLKNPDIGFELMKILAERLANTTKYATRLENDIVKYREELRKLKGSPAKEEKKTNILKELQSRGYITENQAAECVQEYNSLKKKGEAASLPRILIEKKYLSVEQFMRFLEMRQVV